MKSAPTVMTITQQALADSRYSRGWDRTEQSPRETDTCPERYKPAGAANVWLSHHQAVWPWASDGVSLGCNCLSENWGPGLVKSRGDHLSIEAGEKFRTSLSDRT